MLCVFKNFSRIYSAKIFWWQLLTKALNNVHIILIFLHKNSPISDNSLPIQYMIAFWAADLFLINYFFFVQEMAHKNIRSQTQLLSPALWSGYQTDKLKINFTSWPPHDTKLLIFNWPFTKILTSGGPWPTVKVQWKVKNRDKALFVL